MNLSKSTLAATYTLLCTIDPFNKWNLPPAADITFTVINDPDCTGSCGPKQIQVSRACCSHISTLIKTMAHEMIHLKRQDSLVWANHDKEFKRLARLVALNLGLDPKEL